MKKYDVVYVLKNNGYNYTWEQFEHWMGDKTVSIDVDGTAIYYQLHIDRFVRSMESKKKFLKAQCNNCQEIIEVGKGKTACECGGLWLDPIGGGKYRVIGDFNILNNDITKPTISQKGTIEL